MTSNVAQATFSDYDGSVAQALDLIDAGRRLPQTGLIIIKPNLTNSSPPPVTTPVAAVRAVYDYCRAHTTAEIIIGEGCGSGTTASVSAALGYADLAKDTGLRLVDFNDAESVELANPDALLLKRFHMPRIVQDAFVISVPILKDHSFTRTTLAMKNMFGIAPGRYYAGAWNKAKLHSPSTDKAVVDICSYKKPDLSVIDASVGLKGSHLSGRTIKPGLILASFDPVAVDAAGSRLLGHDPAQLEYLRLADGLLGSMQNSELIEA